VRVAFDVGGTFTDVVLLTKDQHVVTAKIPSILTSLGGQLSEFVAESGAGVPEQFYHATTTASNMVIEGTSARTGFVTTSGFRDVLEMRGHRRPSLYDPTWERMPSYIPRALCREVDGRILSSGEVDTELDVEGVKIVLLDLADQGVEAVAVGLVNSYVNDSHERAIAEIARTVIPEIPVSVSAELNSEINEYERASTAAINASLIPGIRQYLDALERGIPGLKGKLVIMRSNGGLMTADVARENPIYMIESGPAAGALAAAALARQTKVAHAIAFDMGGTTAKACVVDHGVPGEKPGGEIGRAVTSTTRLWGGGGYAVRVPSLDIVEVGAGGGSIAWVDDALHVGPQSAGADPGPACYGRGGRLPTVTDANVALGYISPTAIAGSRLTIDAAAARQAIDEHVAQPLGLELHEAALGIVRVANATMMRALRAVTSERGRDPRDMSMIAFGGSGPLHAASLADVLGIAEVRVPVMAGIFSAVGLLFADFRSDHVRTIASPLTQDSVRELSRMLSEMEQHAADEMARQGVSPEDMVFERYCDLRHEGQLGELSVAVPDHHVGGVELIDELLRRLDDAHAAEYGHASASPVEVIAARLRATGRRQSPSFADVAGQFLRQRSASEAAERQAHFGESAPRTVSVVDRWGLSGEFTAGPFIIEDPDTTVLVPPGWQARLDEEGTVVLCKQGRRESP